MRKRHCEGRNFGFLIGKSIEKVEVIKAKNKYGCSLPNIYVLTCNDGTIIKVKENEGCGGCSNGWSSINLKKLEKNHNVITNVKCEYNKNDGDLFKLFIFYQDNQLTIKGDDGYGNGYYGGGFYVTIKEVKGDVKNEDNNV